MSRFSMLIGILFLPLFAEAFQKIKPRRSYRYYNIGSERVRVCRTAECLKMDQFLRERVNFAADPCENFYDFACGSYKKEDVILTTITRDIFKQIDDIVLDTRPNNRSMVQIMRNFYKSCLTQEEDEAFILRQIIDELGGWTLINEDPSGTLTEILSKYFRVCRKYGLLCNDLFTITVESDYRNVNRKRIHIKYAGASIDSGITFTNEHQKVIDADGYVGLNKIHKILFEVALAVTRTADIYPDGQNSEDINYVKTNFRDYSIRVDSNKLWKKMRIGDLSAAWPNLPLKSILISYFSPIPLSDNEEIYVYCTTCMNNFNTFFPTLNTYQLSAYLWAGIIMELVPYATNTTRKYQEQINTDFNPRSDERICLDITKKWFRRVIDSRWNDEYTYDKKIDDSELIINHIMKVFNESIVNSNLKLETKRLLVDKIRDIDTYISWSPELDDESEISRYYEDLELQPNQFLRSAIKLKQTYLRRYLERLRANVTAKNGKTLSDVYVSSAQANAFYITEENRIHIGGGILDDLLLSSNRPSFLNYGLFAFIVAHEIGHGFGPEGIKYGKSGSCNDLYTQAEEDQVYDKIQCYINQYSRLRLSSTTYLDGKLTLEENLADHFGVNLAYRAYNLISPRRPSVIPSFLQYTRKQMYWISLASLFCNPDDYSVGDTHSPGRYRVNMPLRNNPFFLQDFKCFNNKTYMNSGTRCQPLYDFI